jgi:cell division protein FtsL
MSADAHNLLMTRRGRIFLITVTVAIVAAVAIFGRLYGQRLAYGAMQDRDSAIHQLEVERQQLQLEKSSQVAHMTTMHTDVQRLQAKLEAIIPSENRYSIDPNQSLVLADGHLTVGLIGAPRDDGIDININGKRYSAVVGDLIHVTSELSTACSVKIQSFDMFKAQFTASCAADKTG